MYGSELVQHLLSELEQELCTCQAAALAVPRTPPRFKSATCKGSLLLGSACGDCERCSWERERMRAAALDPRPVTRCAIHAKIDEIRQAFRDSQPIS